VGHRDGARRSAVALKRSRPSRHVTRHWLCQQVASALLIPLSLYALVTFFRGVVMNGGSYENALKWLQCPATGLMMILLLGAGIYHGANGLIGIIEDYVHHRALNRFGVLAVKAGAWILALAGMSSVLKITEWV
jgi:succinate dehydrogenase hydrophobic membrane anchor protein